MGRCRSHHRSPDRCPHGASSGAWITGWSSDGEQVGNQKLGRPSSTPMVLTSDARARQGFASPACRRPLTAPPRYGRYGMHRWLAAAPPLTAPGVGRTPPVRTQPAWRSVRPNDRSLPGSRERSARRRSSPGRTERRFGAAELWRIRGVRALIGAAHPRAECGPPGSARLPSRRSPSGLQSPQSSCTTREAPHQRSDRRRVQRRLVILVSEDVGMADPTSLRRRHRRRPCRRVRRSPRGPTQPGPRRRPPGHRPQVQSDGPRRTTHDQATLI